MSADIKQLRTRIKSVDSTLHLTKAMGLVASSKIRRATDSMLRGKEYAASLEDVVAQLVSCEECRRSPYMSQRGGDSTCLMVIAGDRGLAGGYNANVFRAVREYPNAQIIPVGKRACERFGGEMQLAEGFTYAEALSVAEEVCLSFQEGKIDRFGVVCTEYHSMMSQEARVRWFLPLSADNRKKGNTVFEPDELTVLNAVIPEYIAGMILCCVKESFACEVAARRVAMDSAGKNAQEMIDRLGLEYNRARQGAITQEITEIVAGSGM